MAKPRSRKPGGLAQVRAELRAYSLQDKRDHARLYTAVGKTNDKIDTLTGTVSDMRQELGESVGQLRVMSENRAEARESKKFRHSLTLKLASVVAACAAGLTHLLHMLLR